MSRCLLHGYRPRGGEQPPHPGPLPRWERGNAEQPLIKHGRVELAAGLISVLRDTARLLEVGHRSCGSLLVLVRDVWRVRRAQV